MTDSPISRVRNRLTRAIRGAEVDALGKRVAAKNARAGTSPVHAAAYRYLWTPMGVLLGGIDEKAIEELRSIVEHATVTLTEQLQAQAALIERLERRLKALEEKAN